MPSAARPPLRAVLLDMDGTLVDSGIIVERHWRRFAERHGLSADGLLDVHGVRSADVIARVAPWLDSAAEAVALDAAEEADTDGLRAVAGAHDLLAALPPERWALVTSAHRGLALGRMEHLGLPLPEVLVCGDEIEHGKPDPEGYLAAAARLGADPADCLVVEDSRAGIGAGRSAGMLVVGITTNHTAEQIPGAHAYVADLSELGAAVAAVGRALPA
jgi:mannitol-1-/sugar-/sorbitol-6-phosphatase